MKRLIIEREVLKNNVAVVKDRAAGAYIYAVLTGDGFGAGIVELAQLLREEGIGRFAVSEPGEAAALRKAGLVEEEILMLRCTADREELGQLLDLNVVCTVGSADTGMALNAVAGERSTVAEAHIQIDTGMGFGGFLSSEPDRILSVYRSLPNVALSGIYTQLHTGGRRDGHSFPTRRSSDLVLCPAPLGGRPVGRRTGGLRPAGPLPPHPGRRPAAGGPRRSGH